jgi:hypothetical protein
MVKLEVNSNRPVSDKGISIPAAASLEFLVAVTETILAHGYGRPEVPLRQTVVIRDCDRHQELSDAQLRLHCGAIHRWAPIPAHELYGGVLMEMNRPGEAEKQFVQALERTPGRPKAIYRLAESAQAPGGQSDSSQEYSNFLREWKDADQNLPESPPRSNSCSCASAIAALRAISRAFCSRMPRSICLIPPVVPSANGGGRRDGFHGRGIVGSLASATKRSSERSEN